jgi:hypothetical protein
MISITPEVSVRYDIRPGDLAAILIENQRRHRVARPSMPLLVFAFMAGMLAFFGVYLIRGRYGTAGAIFAGAFVTGAVAIWSPRQARQIAVARVARKLTDPGNAFLLGPRTLELGAEGFAVRGPDSDLRYSWATLKRAVEMPDRILLYLTDISAHPLPLNAADAQSVMAAIRKYAPQAAA